MFYSLILCSDTASVPSRGDVAVSNRPGNQFHLDTFACRCSSHFDHSRLNNVHPTIRLNGIGNQ